MLAPRLNGRHARMRSTRAHPIIPIFKKPTRNDSAAAYKMLGKRMCGDTR